MWADLNPVSSPATSGSGATLSTGIFVASGEVVTNLPMRDAVNAAKRGTKSAAHTRVVYELRPRI